MEKKNHVVFLDAVGRTIMGENVGETETYIEVKNPAVANVVPQEVVEPDTGRKVTRIALQILPVFFKEFLLEKETGSIFQYRKDAITLLKPSILLDVRLYEQYNMVFADMPQQQVTQPIIKMPSQGNSPESQSTPKINLFDGSK